MVSAWDVYLVMQLDSVFWLLTLFCFILGMMTIACAIGWADSGEPDKTMFGARAKRAAYGLSAMMAVAAILPSSRTAAAMILIPKLTSPEVTEPVGKEAKELYGLVKQAIRKLGEDEKPAK